MGTAKRDSRTARESTKSERSLGDARNIAQKRGMICWPKRSGLGYTTDIRLESADETDNERFELGKKKGVRKRRLKG